MEEQVGDGVPLHVLPALDLRLGDVGSQAQRDNLRLAAVDHVAADGVDLGLDLDDAGAHLLDRVEVLVCEFAGGLALQAGGQLVGEDGGEVHLEAEGQHALVDLGRGDGGGDGRGLDLGQDGEEGVEDVLGLADGGVVQRVDHLVLLVGGGRCVKVSGVAWYKMEWS